MKGVRPGEVVAINGPIAECEKGGEGRIYEVRRKQVQQRSPAALPVASRPWPDDAPPKCEGTGEKADVLKRVPMFVSEGKIIGHGHMPAEEDHIHCHPCHQWRHE